MSKANPISVYVAASSTDIDRAERWIGALRANDVIVTSTWPENIRKVGAANPRNATLQQRLAWSFDDFNEIAAATAFWLLVPPLDKPTRGAWIELGAAHIAGKPVICSGDCRQSIFCSVGVEFETDEEAFTAVVRGLRLRAGGAA